MHRKYSIGFFVGVLLLSALYWASDCWTAARNEVRNQEVQAQEVTKSKDEKVYQEEEAYYLMEEEGCVYVYEKDGQTLYERTSIAVEQLPEELKEEIREGKPVKDKQELYSFLENYSS